MAKLNSPGVAVTVVDESFYTPAAPGTTPLIIVASQQDKTNSAGTGIASGTTKANAGQVYLLTSQLDLGSAFGTPYFQTDAGNNPVHAGELNEYGLQAAHSYLGVSSRAYVLRADVNTSQLIGNSNIPAGSPTNGTYWLDTTDTAFGVFEWNSNPATTSGGQSFTNRVPAVITDETKLDASNSYAPLASFGAIGTYAITSYDNKVKLFFKNYKGNWVQVGTNAWTKSWPAVTSTLSSPTMNSSYSLTIAATGNGLPPTITTTATATTAPRTVTVTATAITNNLITGTNTLAAGDVIVFNNSFNGVSANTTYYVLGANLSGTNFAVSLSPGGAPVTITSTGAASATGNVTTLAGTPCNVITSTGAGTNLVVGNPIQFSGTTFGSIVAGTTYYILSAAGNYFTISATQGGVPFLLSTASGSMSAVETEQSVTVTGVTTFAQLATAINGKIAGVTAEVNVSNQLAIYIDGTVDQIVLSGTLCGTSSGGSGLSAGTYASPLMTIAPHTQVPAYKSTDASPRPTGSVWVKSTYPNLGANWSVLLYNTTTNKFSAITSPLYATPQAAIYGLDPSGGGVNIAVGALFVKFNVDEYTDNGVNPAIVDFAVYRRANAGYTTVTTNIIKANTFTSGVNTFSAVETVAGSATLSNARTVSFTATNNAIGDANALSAAINAAGWTNITAEVNPSNQVVIKHVAGGDIRFLDGTNIPLNKAGLVPGTTANLYSAPSGEPTYYFGVASNWKLLTTDATAGITYSISATTPTTLTTDGTLWYNSSTSDVDIMVNDGTHWRGLNNYNFTTGASASFNYAQSNSPFGGANATDPNGPFVQATAPTRQTDGTALVKGDLWVDTSDLENFPKIYAWDTYSLTWVLKDNTDGTTENGIIFRDARWNATGLNSAAGAQDTIITMMNSDFVDFDCPDPALYPKGMLLWNLRRSSFNVKKFVHNYVDTKAKNPRSWTNESQTAYYPHTWVSQAANQPKGQGTFGRKAQRAVIVQALANAVATNQAIRNEDSLNYNLIACPGYPELIDELVALNYDRGIQSFVVADTPARLTPDTTSLSRWGNNTAGAPANGETGLTTTDPYLAVYYPWGYTTDNLGNNVVVPPSHMMLRTIALSDNVSYPWFAPAGTRRGGITNASAVGYVDATGTFQSVALNTNQRDTLAGVHVNPISFVSGTGLVAYGQYTRQLAASSLDRINVARLVVYLRRQFNILAKPFVFEPNDTITRNEIKNAADSLLLELVGQRAIYDYLVVCDSSNNTTATIDRSELHLDVAIEPVKAAEFIYIPLRLEKTGAIKALG